jgi:AsmA-like C-terminal region/AsmA family
MLKKILKTTAIILAVLVALAISLPFIFKGKILALARAQVNKSVNATVDFSDVDISLFRHFPRLAVGLENLQVVGAGAFEKDTLISASRIDVALNLMSLFGGSEMNIYSISLDKPRIHAIVNKEGKANWDISKPDSTAATGNNGNFRMHLQSYKINDAYISYVDIPGDMSSEIRHLDHSGSGDFTSELFTLNTKTSAESVSFTYTKIPWLVDAKAELTVAIEVDAKASRYQFKTDDIHLNDLQLSTEGYFQFVNDSTYGMDIKFHTPSTAFKTLLSLIPSIYKTEFDKIKTSGNASFDGMVKGEYNSSKIPSYAVNLKVENGFFQYPDLPQPVQNIGIDMKIQNPDGITDHTVVDISRGHIEFGKDPFDFRILFKNPVTVQYLDATLKGKLNLADITRFVKLKAGTSLSGLLDANASAKGNLSAITKQQAGPFTANGFVNITGLNYSSPYFPQPIRNSNIQLAFQNSDGLADHTLVQIPAAHIEIGSDPLDFHLSVKTPVSNLVFDGGLKGSFNLANAKQLTSLPEGTSLSGILAGDISFSGNRQAIDKKQYDKINWSGTLNAKSLNYTSKEYPDGLLINDAAFSFNPKNITLNAAHAEYLKTHYIASGTIDNAVGYVLKNEPLSGNLNLYADQIDLNRLMSTVPVSSDSSKTKATAPFLVPKNLSFLIQAKVDRMHYDKVDYSNLSGAIAINEEVIALKDVQMEALDGKLKASGFYSTRKDKKNPDISFNYEVSGLNIQKTFLAFNTVQKLMPMGQYVDGKMNSQLSMNGKLGADMMPDLNTLTGKGNLFFVDGVFKKFAPVEKLAETIHLEQLKGMSLKDVKFSYEFANGKVLVQPFHVKLADIDMQVGGMHGFDQSIDYVVAMKVPRAMLGGEVNNLVNNLAQQAVSKGVPVKVSDNINLKIDIVGTVSNPQIKTGLNTTGTDLSAEVKQQAAVFAKQATDSVKTVANAKTNEAKDSAVAIKNQAVKDLQKDLGKSITGQKDSTGNSGKTLETTQKNAEKTLKNTFDNMFSRKKASKDTTKVKSE